MRPRRKGVIALSFTAHCIWRPFRRRRFARRPEHHRAEEDKRVPAHKESLARFQTTEASMVSGFTSITRSSWRCRLVNDCRCVTDTIRAVTSDSARFRADAGNFFARRPTKHEHVRPLSRLHIHQQATLKSHLPHRAPSHPQVFKRSHR